MTVPLPRGTWSLRGRGRPELPDYVDLEQLCERMSIVPDKITKLRRRREFPNPHLYFRSQPLWYWPHVSLWMRQSMMRKRGSSVHRLRTQDVIPALDLVGLTEIASRLEMPVGVLRAWSRSGQFPKPDYRWSDGDAWTRRTVEIWAEARKQRSLAQTKLTADVTEARRLVGQGAPTYRLRQLIEEVATDEASVLGQSTLPSHSDLSDAEFAAQFDAMEARLEELGRKLEAMEQ